MSDIYLIRNDDDRAVLPYQMKDQQVKNKKAYKSIMLPIKLLL